MNSKRSPDLRVKRIYDEPAGDDGRRVLVENDFPSATVTALESLIQEIPDSPIRPLRDTAAPDTAAWQRYLMPHLKQDWLQVPWFFAETYFYRRVLEATGYFQPGPGHLVDPFLYQKQQGLETTQEAIAALSERVNEWLAQNDENRPGVSRLLAIALWGNQADLSMWPADGEGQRGHVDVEQQQAHTLVDDGRTVAHHLASLEAELIRVDFMMDNAGFELVSDLCLADYLLSGQTAAAVHLHLKPHPTFVSDATIKDVRETVDYLAAVSHVEVNALAQRLQDHLHNGRLRLRHHYYWTSPLSGWEMPSSLQQELAQSHLVISKGDANYRRLLGDRHWAFTTPLADIVSYFPAPLLALRTLKSEVAAGLPPGQPEALAQEDADWMVIGEWGVIQFVS
jgi:uncharacterized protein with ATP-grasp and redox domains